MYVLYGIYDISAIYYIYHIIPYPYTPIENTTGTYGTDIISRR